jgi:uncharacterized membrane protein YdjX (TVP38/TMEM64 family)
VLLTLWIDWRPLLNLLALIGNREVIATHVQGVGIWAPLLLTSILSLQVVVAVVPVHLLMMTNGYLYGFSRGLLFNLVGTVGASQLTFVLARRAGRPIAKRLVPNNIRNRWSSIAKRQGFTFYLFFLWFPIIPSNLMNIVAGLSSISFWRFLAANFLGRLPSVVLVTLIGAYGLELSLQTWVIIAVGGVGLFFVGRYCTAKVEQHYLK